jgi:hypothetical protein
MDHDGTPSVTACPGRRGTAAFSSAFGGAPMKVTAVPVAATMLKVGYGAGGRTVASTFPDMG